MSIMDILNTPLDAIFLTVLYVLVVAGIALVGICALIGIIDELVSFVRWCKVALQRCKVALVSFAQRGKGDRR